MDFVILATGEGEKMENRGGKCCSAAAPEANYLSGSTLPCQSDQSPETNQQFMIDLTYLQLTES